MKTLEDRIERLEQYLGWIKVVIGIIIVCGGLLSVPNAHTSLEQIGIIAIYFTGAIFAIWGLRE